MTKKQNDDFENCTKYWMCDNVGGDVKVRDHCHITGKYRYLLIEIVISFLN